MSNTDFGTRGRGDAATRRRIAQARRRFSLRVSASPRPRVFLLVAFALSLAACRQDMQDQPRYEAYEQSRFFADGQASRTYPEGTVARGYLRDDSPFYTGRRGANQPGGAQQPGAGGATQNASQAGATNAPAAATNAPAAGAAQGATGRDGLVDEFPFQITKEDLDRGQQRFQAYCLMCHGATGYGDGMIVRRGFRRPPSFHDDRLRAEPLGHFFDVITNGWGAMASYADMIPPDDRWRIIAYIRALQLSQNAPAGAATTTPPPPPGGPQQQPPQGVHAPQGTGGTNH